MNFVEIHIKIVSGAIDGVHKRHVVLAVQLIMRENCVAEELIPGHSQRLDEKSKNAQSLMFNRVKTFVFL